jgi:hypothetical protein
MRAELKLKPHNFGTRNAAGAPQVIEVWFGGRYVGSVYGSHDGPGIRFTSTFPIKAYTERAAAQAGLHVVELMTRPT